MGRAGRRTAGSCGRWRPAPRGGGHRRPTAHPEGDSTRRGRNDRHGVGCPELSGTTERSTCGQRRRDGRGTPPGRASRPLDPQRWRKTERVGRHQLRPLPPRPCARSTRHRVRCRRAHRPECRVGRRRPPRDRRRTESSPEPPMDEEQSGPRCRRRAAEPTCDRRMSAPAGRWAQAGAILAPRPPSASVRSRKRSPTGPAASGCPPCCRAWHARERTTACRGRPPARPAPQAGG